VSWVEESQETKDWIAEMRAFTILSHTDFAGVELIQSALAAEAPITLVFNRGQEAAAKEAGFRVVYVHRDPE
jgi:hypothetical protein